MHHVGTSAWNRLYFLGDQPVDDLSQSPCESHVYQLATIPGMDTYSSSDRRRIGVHRQVGGKAGTFETLVEAIAEAAGIECYLYAHQLALEARGGNQEPA